MTLADTKAHLSEVVNRVARFHERVTVTGHGVPSAALVAPGDLESMEETIAILSDRQAMDRLARSESDLGAGRVETQAQLAAAMWVRRTHR